MYNKLFTKILDSSIWLESMPTRIVWLTFIAVMDEHGFCQFAAVGNVANRARVSLIEAQEALRCLESPDKESGDPENEGRRIERVPGGWMVLNAQKHRSMVTRAIIQEQTRERVKRHRAKKRDGNASVTPSEAIAEADTNTEVQTLLTKSPRKERAETDYPADFLAFWEAYPKRTGKGAAARAWKRGTPPIQPVLDALRWQVGQPQWTRDGGQYIPHAATWLNQRRWEDEAFHPPQDLTPDKSDGYGTRAMKIVMGARAARGELPGQQLTPDEQHQKFLEAAFASSAAIAKGRL